ncbi:hypothetical protein [Prevotella denticola]|uniref:hypothetical protein n=1 Tax=Prevotella denticola TaxID=28129 RepID=UPI001BA8F56D|nr:hypothetical protein [Prevotella denticola]QUB89877.1 hypothetical protein J4855_06235 [Prevotella denticola]
MNRQEKEFYKSFAEHGIGEAKVCISPKEVLVLLYITATDLRLQIPTYESDKYLEVSAKGFYYISHEDVDSLPEISQEDCFCIMEKTGVTNYKNISYLYMINLCALYRRRVKYHHILKKQSFPNAEQIVPRSLLEYGNCENQLLADWLEWRKWIFDIDNRSAQETGYVFEPVLASCLGGEPVSGKNSPVRRIDGKGNPMENRRQVDCYIKDSAEVYELKMRMTIAASGQGRFNEEMTFPKEAQAAGLTPILVVFDGNESELLNKLKKQYQDCGGKYYIGEEAWNMLRDRAGVEMGVFINKYIYPPINSMESFLKSNPHAITLSKKDSKIVISGAGSEYVIDRI